MCLGKICSLCKILQSIQAVHELPRQPELSGIILDGKIMLMRNIVYGFLATDRFLSKS